MQIWFKSTSLEWSGSSLVREFALPYTNHLEKAMATHSSTLAWQIPWVEETGGLQSMGSLGVGKRMHLQ